MIQLIEIPTDSEIQKAIELRSSRVFPAMDVANTLAGDTSAVHWRLIREYTFTDLIEEAMNRNLDFDEFRTSVERKPVTDTEIFMKAFKELTKDDN
jgi:hypothetical protein